MARLFRTGSSPSATTSASLGRIIARGICPRAWLGLWGSTSTRSAGLGSRVLLLLLLRPACLDDLSSTARTHQDFRPTTDTTCLSSLPRFPSLSTSRITVRVRDECQHALGVGRAASVAKATL